MTDKTIPAPALPGSANGNPGTAAAHATANVPIVRPDESVDAVLRGLRGRHFSSASVVAVCVDGELRGLATIERILAAPHAATMDAVMDPEPPVVGPGTDQESAAWRAVRHGEPGLAVVDADGRLVGLVPPQRLLEVLLEEHDEDLARMGGFMRDAAAARSATVETVRRRLWHRLPWLAVGLVGAMLSAVLMGAFEAELSANLVVAYFIPGIVYLADAVGTQTEAVAIRGLSVGVGIRRLVAPETLTGLMVGAMLGGLMFAVIVGVWQDPGLAAAVAIATLAASSSAVLVALALPWLLHRLGHDPAFGSGPLATVVQDLLTIVVYFAAVTVLVR
ncbi:magnesium transporter [Asanoa hainanensis]|uniref:magnesium transporter n=1 Tax=Asanoa hainanensis TaxID=560556 RepID=UPI001FEBE8E7|nr:magnesium transporter [Asanoa hainanensis]